MTGGVEVHPERAHRQGDLAGVRISIDDMKAPFSMMMRYPVCHTTTHNGIAKQCAVVQLCITVVAIGTHAPIFFVGRAVIETIPRAITVIANDYHFEER